MSSVDVEDSVLLQHAIDVTRKAQEASKTRPYWQFMGYVGSALVTDQGNIFTGVVLNLQNGIGFCAEHSAVAEMIKNGESRILKIAGATAKGTPLSPCGRCREMMFQIDPANIETEVIMPEGGNQTLRDLLPGNWQPYWDA